MPFPILLAIVVVAITALYLVAFGLLCLAKPQRAGRFLLGFAGTPIRHVAELAARVAAGTAFIVASPALPGSTIHLVLGWVLVATTAALALAPWRWHQRIARQSVPPALRFLPVIGIVSFVAGSLILAAVFGTSASWNGVVS